MSNYSKLALFVGGTLFGSVGLKLLSSREAKNIYVHVAAAGLRIKDSTMEAVTAVQESTSDILADARELNEERAAAAAAKAAEAEIQDEAEVQDEADVVVEA